ncbi:MAG: glycoside hydrolase family 13 protein [Clostridia bacterium]|nr:glycoside hydrolase family 13 protein [Clostridia bacterium]
MQYYPFDSRKVLYRRPYGAVKENEKLLIRLLLHSDAHVHNAFLRIVDDRSGDMHEIELAPREWFEGYRFYDTDITLPDGLYWYDFRYTSDYGQFFVVRENGGRGVVSKSEGVKWQITVYLSDFKTPDWLKGGIIYQIFPDRFFSSAVPKNNIPEDRYLCEEWSAQPEYRQNGEKKSLGNDYFGGDLKGIKEKLSYLKDLGVTCIYLNPVFEAHSNHRYNTADYLKIDCMLGDESDLKDLCKEAKENGIGIILDGVFSHTGDDSIYFNKYGRYGEGGAYRDYSSKYHNWYKFNRFPDDYAAWWGVPSLPETNEENESFSEFITGKDGVLRHWLRAGISGWRLDVADELPDSFLDKIRTAIKEENPEAFLLGEVWEDASNKISYGARRRFLRGRQLDSVMNYVFANAIIDFVRNSNAKKLQNAVEDVMENYPCDSVHLLMNHIGTHDTARVLTVLGRKDCYTGDREWQSKHRLTQEEYLLGLKRLKIAAILQYTLPGVPSVFYGDETGVEGFGDPFCRLTYPWGAENTDLLNFYRKLGKVRRGSLAFKEGKFKPFIANGDLFAFIRKKGSNRVFIAVNRGEEDVNLTLPDEFVNVKSIFGTAPDNDLLCLHPFSYSVITTKE